MQNERVEALTADLAALAPPVDEAALAPPADEAALAPPADEAALAPPADEAALAPPADEAARENAVEDVVAPISVRVNTRKKSEEAQLNDLFRNWATDIKTEEGQCNQVVFPCNSVGILGKIEQTMEYSLARNNLLANVVKSLINFFASKSDIATSDDKTGIISFRPSLKLGQIMIYTNPRHIYEFAQLHQHLFVPGILDEFPYTSVIVYAGVKMHFIMYLKGAGGAVLPGCNLRAPPDTKSPSEAIIHRFNVRTILQVAYYQPIRCYGTRLGILLNSSQVCWFGTSSIIICFLLNISPVLDFINDNLEELQAIYLSNPVGRFHDLFDMFTALIDYFHALAEHPGIISLKTFESFFFSLREWDTTDFSIRHGDTQHDCIEFIDVLLSKLSTLEDEMNTRLLRGGVPQIIQTFTVDRTQICKLCGNAKHKHEICNFLHVHVREPFPEVCEPTRYIGIHSQNMSAVLCDNEECRAQAIDNSEDGVMHFRMFDRYSINLYLPVVVHRTKETGGMWNGQMKIGPIKVPGRDRRGNDMTMHLVPIMFTIRRGGGASRGSYSSGGGHYEYVVLHYNDRLLTEGDLEDKQPVAYRAILLGEKVHQTQHLQGKFSFGEISEKYGSLVTFINYKRVKTTPGIQFPDEEEMHRYYQGHGMSVNQAIMYSDDRIAMRNVALEMDNQLEIYNYFRAMFDFEETASDYTADVIAQQQRRALMLGYTGESGMLGSAGES